MMAIATIIDEQLSIGKILGDLSQIPAVLVYAHMKMH